VSPRARPPTAGRKRGKRDTSPSAPAQRPNSSDGQNTGVGSTKRPRSSTHTRARVAACVKDPPACKPVGENRDKRKRGAHGRRRARLNLYQASVRPGRDGNNGAVRRG
jgi:hypothetical protein